MDWNLENYRLSRQTIAVGTVSLLLFLWGAACGGDAGDTTGDSADDVGSDTGIESDTVDPNPDGDDTGASSPDGSHDARISDPVLESGGIAITDAVALGAAENTVDGFVSVASESTSDPTGETPLPAEASPTGEFIALSSGRDIELTPDDAPLFVAVPFPEEVEPSNLALAALAEGDGFPGRRADSLSSIWTILPGIHDPNSGFFVAPIRSLTAEATTIALVESEQYDAPEIESSYEPTSDLDDELLDDEGYADAALVDAVEASVEATRQFLDSGTESEDFYVECLGFDGDGCGLAERSTVRDQLRELHDDFAGDLRNPALRRTLPNRTVDGDEGRFYRYVLRSGADDAACDDAESIYVPISHSGITCHDPSEDETPSEPSTRMAAFHAIQYAYEPFSWSQPLSESVDWIHRGQATFAQNADSDGSTAIRYDGGSGSAGLRKIDKSLTLRIGEEPYPAYGAQDFWVFLTDSREASTAEIIEPVLAAGDGTPDTPGLQKVDTLFEMTEAHWGWVRNQAFEAWAAEGNPALGETCVPNNDAWSSLAAEYDFDPSTDARPFQETITLEDPWSAAVVKVNFHNGLETGAVKTQLQARSGEGFAKAYPVRASSSSECVRRAEEHSTTQIGEVVEEGNDWSSYLLLSKSNGSTDATKFKLEIEALEPVDDQRSPKATIVRPKPTGNHALPLERLVLEAEASDPGGGYIASFEWEVSDGNGTSRAYSGNDRAIADFWDEGFQPGVFTITLSVTDDDGHEAAVTVERDLQPE